MVSQFYMWVNNMYSICRFYLVHPTNKRTYKILTVTCVLQSWRYQSTNKNWIDRHELQISKDITLSSIALLCDHKADSWYKHPSLYILQCNPTRIIPTVTCKIIKAELPACCDNFSHCTTHKPLAILVVGRVNHYMSHHRYCL